MDNQYNILFSFMVEALKANEVRKFGLRYRLILPHLDYRNSGGYGSSYRGGVDLPEVRDFIKMWVARDYIGNLEMERYLSRDLSEVFIVYYEPSTASTYPNIKIF